MWNFTEGMGSEHADEIKTKVVLIHDAVKVFYEAVKKMGDFTAARPLSCEDYESWSHGATLLNFMKTVSENTVLDRIFEAIGR